VKNKKSIPTRRVRKWTVTKSPSGIYENSNREKTSEQEECEVSNTEGSKSDSLELRQGEFIYSYDENLRKTI
jgi:hypothetical protein